MSLGFPQLCQQLVVDTRMSKKQNSGHNGKHERMKIMLSAPRQLIA
jgi:hypothetical protein